MGKSPNTPDGKDAFRRHVQGEIHVRGEVEARLPQHLIAKHDTERVQDAAREKWRFRVDVLAMIGVVAASSIAGWQGWLTRRIAQEAVRQTQAQERAWVGFVEPQLYFKKVPTSLTTSVALSNPYFVGKVSNYGHSPAFNVNISVGSEILNGLNAEPPREPIYKESGTTSAPALFPGQPPLSSPEAGIAWTIDVLKEIYKKRQTLNFYALVTYKDGFGQAHTSKFCYHYSAISLSDLDLITTQPAKADLIPCKTYNEAN
jgi:hypothetical protein